MISKMSWMDIMMSRHIKNVTQNNMEEKQYQNEAMRWIFKRESLGLSVSPDVEEEKQYYGGILALEMGLGKTIVMLSTIMSNIKHPVENEKGGTLIIVPSSLIHQWFETIVRFVGIEPTMYYGSKKKKHNVKTLTGDNGYIVLTTYGTINKPWKPSNGIVPPRSILTKIKWGRVIYDEAHHLRVSKSNIHKNASLIQSDINWLLTGTPINNCVSDLISLFEILKMPRHILNNFYKPTNKYDIIKQHVLYNSKKNVGIKLHDTEVENIKVVVEDANERKLIDDIHQLLIANHTIFQRRELNESTVNIVIQQLFRNSLYFELVVRARQSCIIPIKLKDTLDKNTTLLNNTNDTISPNNDFKIMNQSKITAVVNKIKKNKRTGNKIIFCHYRYEIDTIYKTLKQECPNLVVQKVDGRTNKSNMKFALETVITNDELTDIFTNKKFPSKANIIPTLIEKFMIPDVLILQINTCCEGLNLQQFNEVYFTSPHWNPAVEDQAIARVHRIGQKKRVKVVRFITSSSNMTSKYTIDEYCDDVQRFKRDLMRKFITHPSKAIFNNDN
mgnify:CR=1 FL=1